MITGGVLWGLMIVTIMCLLFTAVRVVIIYVCTGGWLDQLVDCLPSRLSDKGHTVTTVAYRLVERERPREKRERERESVA